MKGKTTRIALISLLSPCIVIYFLYASSSGTSLSNRFPIFEHTANHSAKSEREAAVKTHFRAQILPTEEESRDPEWDDKRQTIKRMMSEAWGSYAKYAWGYNELRPVTRDAKLDSIFGSSKLGATIVDSLDTLLLMNLTQEFHAARQWVKDDFNLADVKHQLSVFEIIIRYVGGLLSTFALTGDHLFLNKSLEVAQAMLPAYKTPTGLPNGLIVPSTGQSYHHSWALGSILSEMGTQHLEYVYLSDMSGDFRFRELAFRIRKFLDNSKKPDGLYMTVMDNNNGEWSENRSSLGALGDSFYEYLIKAYVQSGGQDKNALKMYLDSLAAVKKNNMLAKSPQSGLLYLADWVYGKPNFKMQHLACFAAGMYGLGAQHLAAIESKLPVENQTAPTSDEHWEIAKNLTETCYQSYRRTPTGLGPESFYFDDIDDATSTSGDYYILRPEVIESYFVMWRLTGDVRYRHYAWEAAQAIQRHCRTGNGFSGIENVMVNPPRKDNTQQSFFLAETLKYLYLIFSNDKLLPLDKWVFNTEAHPLPVCGANSAYPLELCSVIDSLNNSNQ